MILSFHGKSDVVYSLLQKLSKSSRAYCLQEQGLKNALVKYKASERRLRKELRDIQASPNEAIFLGPDSLENLYKWTAIIKGPEETPYEGGEFTVDINLSLNYPFKPPHVHFITKIYHCNINSNGSLSLDILRDQWSPALTIIRIIRTIYYLLCDPFPDDPLVPEYARLYKNNRAEYEKNAREWTEKYAMLK